MKMRLFGLLPLALLAACPPAPQPVNGTPATVHDTVMVHDTITRDDTVVLPPQVVTHVVHDTVQLPPQVVTRVVHDTVQLAAIVRHDTVTVARADSTALKQAQAAAAFSQNALAEEVKQFLTLNSAYTALKANPLRDTIVKTVQLPPITRVDTVTRTIQLPPITVHDTVYRTDALLDTVLTDAIVTTWKDSLSRVLARCGATCAAKPMAALNVPLNTGNSLVVEQSPGLFIYQGDVRLLLKQSGADSLGWQAMTYAEGDSALAWAKMVDSVSAMARPDSTPQHVSGVDGLSNVFPPGGSLNYNSDVLYYQRAGASNYLSIGVGPPNGGPPITGKGGTLYYGVPVFGPVLVTRAQLLQLTAAIRAAVAAGAAGPVTY